MNGSSASPCRKNPKLIVGPRLSVQRDAVFLLLKQLSAENWAHFDAYRSKSVYYDRIAECCTEISSSTALISELVQKIQKTAQKCDFDEKTPGNGYRSLICVCDMVLLHLVSTLKKCSETRGSLMFRSTTICKELENYVAIFRFLILAFQQTVLMIESLDEGSLFPSLEGDYSLHDGFFKGIESLDASCFYGRSFGFQFVPSVTLIFNVIGIVLATYSLSWGNRSSAFGSLLNSGRYLLNPEQRAKQIIKVTREADIEFCRGFWNLSEIPPPRLFCPALEIYQICHVPMCGTLTLESKTPGTLIPIPEPNVHGPPAPIQIRILSAKHREGLSTKSKVEPLSPNLLIHCHGGGYVATTSKSHETYLRMWAKYIDCPIVSIDYSLSPEFPFPRPTEEVLYAYAWILQNPQKLGWSGQKVILVGDSAGGNLVVSLTLRLIELNAARLPDGLIPIYTPFLFQYLPSPSRVLSFTDPLLHMGVVIRCAAAYTGVTPEGTDAEQRRGSTKDPKHGHKSLSEYVDEVKSKHLVDVNDYSFGSQSILSLVNLSNMGSTKPLQNINENAKMEEDTSKENNEKAEQPEPANEENDENDADTESATVHIDQDSSHISLSACNYDHTLLNYLQSHPLTTNSAVVEGNEPILDAVESSEASTPIEDPETGEVSIQNKIVSQPQQLQNGKRPLNLNSKEVLARRASLSKTVVRTVSTSVSHAFDNISHYIEPITSPVGYVDKPKLQATQSAGFYEAARIQQEEAESLESPLVELLKLKLPRDYLISPMYTPDDLLRQLPPLRFISCHLDPLLDDTITFAKKVRNAGGCIKRIDLLDGLPHGFLNFAPMSTECYEGARLCMYRIKEAFDSSE
ncbi:Hosl-1 [Aphelenchoides bicaudatus]|nr:Hosl-1 [Aphelenchoides bicaudatus]